MESKIVHNWCNEQYAKRVGDNPLAVEIELKQAMELLFEDDQKRFYRQILDLKNKRMLSDDGSKALQWKLRSDPDKPISPDNQQTSKGCVSIVIVDPETVRVKIQAWLLVTTLERHLKLKSKKSIIEQLTKQMIDFVKSL